MAQWRTCSVRKGSSPLEKGDEDTIMEAALEAGAEDVVTLRYGARLMLLHPPGRDG